MNVRTRFAPSPTGYLHVGGVRTALFNYLYAKGMGGKFLLRLEDTDRERFVEEGVAQIVESLEWLGLIPDEGFWISEGKHQNTSFIQSERHNRGDYRKHAERLVQAGLAYYSPTTSSKLQELREDAAKNKKTFLYHRAMDSDNSSTPKRDTPIRLDIRAFFEKFAEENDYFWKNKEGIWQVKWGEATGNRAIVGWSAGTIDDFIIMKADGFPTYNFANVVDDQEMEITHVMRGDEFIASTPKHIILYHALGFKDNIPAFAHLPVINGPDGKKLSKRTGDTNVLDYRSKGYPPEALLNFLVLLGWNDEGAQETFTLDELEKRFSLQRINTSPAVLDSKRLNWISGHHIRELSLDNLHERVESFWPASAANYDDAYKRRVLGLVQERLKYFAELPELTSFFFNDLPVNLELITGNKQLKKFEMSELKDLLEQAKVSLQASDFSTEDLTSRLNALLEQTGQKPGVLFSLIRIATTWAPSSPGLADTLSVLGKERSMARLEVSLDAL